MSVEDNLFGIHGKALALRSQRLSLLASNIANASTPGYKARDIDFEAALKEATAQSSGATSTDMGKAVEDAMGYRVPLQPSLDGNTVELSTEQGHVVALGLPQAPYPLGGEARDVIEDISRLGGFAMAAHPGSEKPELQWTDWDTPVGGLEWLNADSEWRDEPVWSLAPVATPPLIRWKLPTSPAIAA